MIKSTRSSVFYCIAILNLCFIQYSGFALSPGNIVVLKTLGTVSKAASPIYLDEIQPNGTLSNTIALPNTGNFAIQTAGVFGGSEGFLTTSSDGKYLVLAGYNTSTYYADITTTSSATVSRVVGTVSPSGNYIQRFTSSIFFNNNDIRGGVSDGLNFWASGASSANIDGVNYFGPLTPVGLATALVPPKAYGLRLFNGKIFYSTQKTGPTNTTAQLGIFQCGSGLPTNGQVGVTQIINTGSQLPQDFSINANEDVCYIAISSNSATGGIQKWQKSGSIWTLAYTLGTGVANVGAYGLVVDYAGTSPIIYATTYESTGNRIIKIQDVGPSSSATTLRGPTSGVIYKGISFSPVDPGPWVVNLSLSSPSVTEIGNGAVTITATASSVLPDTGKVNISIIGPGISESDYSLSDSVISIPAGSSQGSVTLMATDDQVVEGDETLAVKITSLSSGLLQGSQASVSLIIVDNNTNNPPSISLNTTNTPNSIDGGKTNVGSFLSYSAVLNDSLDPMKVAGLTFTVSDPDVSSSQLVLTCVSQNTSVVSPSGISWIGTGSQRTLKVRASGSGYSTLIVTVSDLIATRSFTIQYACSDGSPDYIPSHTFWHTGSSDGSTGIELDQNLSVIGDDELNVLGVYPLASSGFPVKTFDFTAYLNLPQPSSPEVDVELSVKSFQSQNRSYWSGSMGNGKTPFDNKPNRDRLFAIDIFGTGDSAQFQFRGWVNIRSALLAWGDSHGYNFTSSSSPGVNPKGLDGFSLEGMTFGPDSSTLYLGLRAPLVPTSFRHKAVIAPLLNFESWFNQGNPLGLPLFGSPIELDLDFRGIRELKRLSDGTYIIVAGSPIEDGGVNNLYKWTGYPQDSPIPIINAVGGILNIEGVLEVKDSSGACSKTSLQLISDGGAVNLYGDNNQAKDLADLSLRKFRTDLVEGLDLDLCAGFSAVISPSGPIGWCGGDTIRLSVDSSAGALYSWSQGSSSAFCTLVGPALVSVQKSNPRAGCSAQFGPVTIYRSMPTDINDDRITDNSDFLKLLGRFNQSCSGCQEDINLDGLVDNMDFLVLLGYFNQSCH